MTKHFTAIEEVISDDEFLAWYADSTSVSGQAWMQWLADHPQYRALVDESVLYLNAIRLSDLPVDPQQVEAAHQRLMQAASSKAPVVSLNSRRKWWMAAAVAILIIVTGSVFWKTGKSDQLKLNTTYGQIAKHALPDGSEVMLNANSKLHMKKSWEGTGDREVWLEGEAFFHVKKTSAKDRFIVHADGMDVIVTGTQFNVVNRDGESNVLLKEGSVTIKTNDGKPLKLLPGDFIKIANRQPQKDSAAEEKVLAWTQAKLVFENTPLIDAAKVISRHYGVKVTVEKDVEMKPMGGILSNDNLDVLLKALEACHLHITRKDKEIIISAAKP